MSKRGAVPNTAEFEDYTNDFESVARAERQIVDAQRGLRGTSPNGHIGLALSGGGIRSASFGLGVLQALQRHSLFRLVDYLSTVSGGGYIGSSLSWLLRNGRKDFPLGTKDVGARSGASTAASGSSDPSPNEILSFMRQHGNYLTPDRRGAYSLAALLFRNMLVSLVVYVTVLVFLFSVFKLVAPWVIQLVGRWWPELASVWGFFQEGELLPVGWLLLAGAVLLIAVFVAGSFLYQAVSFVLLLSGEANLEKTTRFRAKSYRSRWWLQKASGKFWFAIAVLGIGGSVPVAFRLLREMADEGIGPKAGVVAVVTTLVGAVGSVREVMNKLRELGEGEAAPEGLKKLFVSIRPGFIAFLLIYGVLLLSYWLADIALEDWPAWWPLAALAGAALVAGTTSLNFVGLNRMYRDRLMELFLADDDVIRRNAWSERADTADATQLWKIATNSTVGPYHILNATMISVDDENSKYRGRGGDSFMLSPLYCGSNATGWRRTGPVPELDPIRNSDAWWMRGGLTLPSAMAISGAAVNPNTGIGGRGPTRSRAVSMFMALLNLRLGYWAHNPRKKPWFPKWRANLLYPGLWQGLFGRGLNSKKPYIELSDGGHFENLGAYELVRRRVDTIIVSDASADPEHSLASLANAVERVRVDFGVSIYFDQSPLSGLLPKSAEEGPETDKYHLAKRGYAVATIKYPADAGKPAKQGKLIYIKPVLTPNLTADVLGYKDANKDFPHEWTADQFFHEEQFEAYRELGYRLTDHMCDDLMSERLTIEALVVRLQQP
jgi:hypothetical protein